MDIFQVIAHLIVSGTVHRENKSYLFFTNVVHQLVVVGSWEPCFPESLRCSRIARRPQRWLSFLTSLSPTRCHQPKVSAARGKKAIPCLRHNSSAPFSFSSYLADRAWPGFVAACSTRSYRMGVTTVASNAASLSCAQLWSRTSAGLLSQPGSRNLPSLTGPRPATAAESKIASLRWLCLAVQVLIKILVSSISDFGAFHQAKNW